MEFGAWLPEDSIGIQDSLGIIRILRESGLSRASSRLAGDFDWATLTGLAGWLAGDVAGRLAAAGWLAT